MVIDAVLHQTTQKLAKLNVRRFLTFFQCILRYRFCMKLQNYYCLKSKHLSGLKYCIALQSKSILHFTDNYNIVMAVANKAKVGPTHTFWSVFYVTVSSPIKKRKGMFTICLMEVCLPHTSFMLWLTFCPQLMYLQTSKKSNLYSTLPYSTLPLRYTYFATSM